jgi:hypothetical protein
LFELATLFANWKTDSSLAMDGQLREYSVAHNPGV